MAHPDESFGNKDTEAATRVPGSEGKPRHKAKGSINPNSRVDVKRLRESMNWSDKQLSPFRDRYYESLRFYAGNRYGSNTRMDKTPLNLLHLAVNIWLRQLVAATPRCLVLTRMPELKPSAYELEIATDYMLREINFGSSLSECVRSAIFSVGAMKVGITSKYLAEGTKFTSAGGQPYADPILFEDLLFDMTARREEECDWIGNRYTLPYEMVMANPDFSKKVKDALKPRSELGDTNNFGGREKNNSHNLSQSDSPDRVEYDEVVELVDVWIPRENVFVTLPVQDGLGPLETRDWEGPEKGPYHILGFSRVPGNIIPVGPVQQIHDLQDVITRMFNQLADQGLRQKTLTLADGPSVASGDAAAVMEAHDGQVIQVTNPDGIRELKQGGIDPGSQAFLVYLRELLSYSGGNIDALGGLAQQAGTLGQEELLASSSSQMIQDMQQRVVDFTQKIVKDLAWYMYTDPTIELPLVKNIKDYGEISFNYGPQDRNEDYFNFHFQIQPYSLQGKGPSQRLQQLRALMQGEILPLAPQLEQFGVTLNLSKYMEIQSKYGDLPEIEDLLSSEQPTPYEDMMMAQAAAGERPTQSPVTQRNYTRKNIPTGGTKQNQDADMVKTLMGQAGQQQKQGGPTGG